MLQLHLMLTPPQAQSLSPENCVNAWGWGCLLTVLFLAGAVGWALDQAWPGPAALMASPRLPAARELAGPCGPQTACTVGTFLMPFPIFKESLCQS